MQETVAVAWCDNGDVDGKFMQGVTDVLLKSGVKFETSIRSQGNQIARQREKVIKFWYEENLSEWLLWVDSDIVISPDNFLKLWNQKDKEEKPLLTGVYFTTDNPEEPLMVPKPTIYEFAEFEGGVGIKRIHPLPKDKFMKVDAAGMGFVLMHRSVVERIMKEVPGVPFFTEMGADKQFMGEDIYFFAICGKAGVPLWCDTSVLLPHMKRFSFDVHYYNAMYGEERKK